MPRSFIISILITFACVNLISCKGKGTVTPKTLSTEYKTALENRIKEIIKDRPGRFGIAVIYNDTDTLTVNDTSDYPLMSMFKLHEALAVCHTLDRLNISLDTTLNINRKELDMDTWSPMLRDSLSESFSISAEKLLDYTLVHSDNNTSNILFDRIVTPHETDIYIRSISPEGDFNISYTEADMKKDIPKSYANRTSPLSYACLVNKIFTDSIVSADKQDFIKEAMARCATGMERIAAGLPDSGISFAHRTGTGYTTPDGKITAINDGGYVRLPDGTGYSIAIFVKDFEGNQEIAERTISLISKTVYDTLNHISIHKRSESF